MLPNAQLQLVPACDIGSILKESLWLISGSLSLWLTYLLTKSLLGSQGPCSARSSAAALQHFMLVCKTEWVKSSPIDQKGKKWTPNVFIWWIGDYVI